MCNDRLNGVQSRDTLRVLAMRLLYIVCVFAMARLGGDYIVGLVLSRHCPGIMRALYPRIMIAISAYCPGTMQAYPGII